MQEVNDLIYLNYDSDLNRVISYGIEFREFMQSLSKRPENILVLDGDFGSSVDSTTGSEYCIGEDIDEFIKEDVYNYGNFSWIDFECVDNLKALTPQEVAEILYIGKLWRPVNSTFFEKLNNRFVYTAHDDGWINYTFYNNALDFQEVVRKVIVSKAKEIYGFDLDLIDPEIIITLCELSKKGIAIDFLRLSIEEDGTTVIPIYIVGKMKDMDKVYTVCREEDVVVEYELRYKDTWSLLNLG